MIAGLTRNVCVCLGTSAHNLTRSTIEEQQRTGGSAAYIMQTENQCFMLQSLSGLESPFLELFIH